MPSTDEIIREIERAFRELNIGNPIRSNLPGLIFELYSLVDILKKLKNRNYTISAQNLFNGTFKYAQKPSIPNRNSYSWLTIQNNFQFQYEIWLNIEFIGISGHYSYRKNIINKNSDLNSNLFRTNFTHELDIAIIRSGINRRPFYYEVKLAVECKDTQNFGKGVLKQLLGIRRELSCYLTIPQMNPITKRLTYQCPPSEYWIYSSNRDVNKLRHVGRFWNLEFIHLRT